MMAFTEYQVAGRFLAAKVDDNFLLKNPHKELRGETIEVSKIPEYEKAVKALGAQYTAAKERLDALPSGKLKGMAGHALAQIGKEGRRARMRLEVAKAMKTKGVTKSKF